MRAFSKSIILLVFVMTILPTPFGCKGSETINPSKFNAVEWEQKIKNPSLTPDEFTQLFAQILRADLNDAQVMVTGPLELSVALPAGTKWKFNLGNMWNEAVKNPEGRPEICRHYLKSMSGMAGRQPGVAGTAETNNVVPTIKDDLFVNQFPKDASGHGLVSERFVADLHIVYATDRDGIIAFLMESDQKRFNLELPSLRNLAVTNLKRISQPVQQRSKGPVFMVTTGDGYSSSLLLLDDFWKAKTNSVQGEIVAVVPARDIVFFTGSASADGIQQMQQIAEKIFATGDHVISKTLLVRHNDHWEKFAN
jgi:uncharacterized protein YtpQ (UPF0354 family)